MGVSTGKVHTDSEFEKELSDLRTTIQEMGCRVEDMCAESIQSLVHAEPQLARGVIERDADVNRLDLRVDEICHQILSLRQPVGKDLRFITTGLKIASDLERVGDLSINLAERVLELCQEPQLKAYIALPQMARASKRDMSIRLFRSGLENGIVEFRSPVPKEVVLKGMSIDV